MSEEKKSPTISVEPSNVDRPDFTQATLNVSVSNDIYTAIMTVQVGNDYIQRTTNPSSIISFLAKDALKEKIPGIATSNHEIDGVWATEELTTKPVTVKFQISPEDAYALGLDLYTGIFEKNLTREQIEKRARYLRESMDTFLVFKHEMITDVKNASAIRTIIVDRLNDYKKQGLNLALLKDFHQKRFE